MESTSHGIRYPNNNGLPARMSTLAEKRVDPDLILARNRALPCPPHLWDFPVPTSPTITGVCRKCGEVKTVLSTGKTV